MTKPQEQSVNSIDQILADAKILRRKLKALDTEAVTAGDILMEITENIIPLIVAAVEEIAEVDDVIQEVIEHEDSYLRDEDAKQLLVTMALGDAMVEAMRGLLEGLEDDLARKRHTELVDGFEQSLEVSKLAIAAIIDGSDDDDDDEDENDSDEEDKDDNSDSDDGIERLDGDAPAEDQ